MNASSLLVHAESLQPSVSKAVACGQAVCAIADVSMQGAPKEVQHLGIELLVECLAVEVRRVRAQFMRASSQDVWTRWQECEVPGVWDGPDICLHRQFGGDGCDVFGRNASPPRSERQSCIGTQTWS